MAEPLYPRLANLMHATSIVACLFVLVSFALFAVDEMGSASDHQQAAIAAGAPVLGPAFGGTPAKPAPTTGKSSGNAVRNTIDDVSSALVSPFKALTSGQSDQWVVHGVNTLGALLLYGFALGFAARLVRVRR